MVNKVVICSAVRTPIGAIAGGLASLQALQLGIIAAKAALQKVRPELVEHSTFGWVGQDIRSPNIGRTIAEQSGVPNTAAGSTVHENCSSGGAAMHDIARRIQLGEISVGMAGGVESMSNIPRYLFQGRIKNQLYGDMPLVDGLMGALTDTLVGKGELMGLLTERLVEKYQVSREMQDEIAFRSHKNATEAWAKGFFDHVVPVTIPGGKKGDIVIAKDEGPRTLDMNYFTSAKPYFKPHGGTITSQNSSTLNDGAAVVILASETRAKELGLPILAELRSFGTVGVPRELMGEGAFKVIPKLLERSHSKIENIDYFDINEAFAAVVGGAFKDIPGLTADKVNQWGSGISLGHPVGCTGVRQVVDMVHNLGKRGKHVGITTRCVGGGMGSGEVVVRH